MAVSPLSGHAQSNLVRWLSQSRLDSYQTAVLTTSASALDLYDWNIEMAAALMRDIALLEVGLRNAYDAEMVSVQGADWAIDPAFKLFNSATVLAGGVDPLTLPHLVKLANLEFEVRGLLANARSHAKGQGRGKVVAELMFGFWAKLTSSALTHSLWTPHLNRAFVAKTPRGQINEAVSHVNSLRNRVAHHEPLFSLNAHIRVRVSEIEFLLKSIRNPIGSSIVGSSRCHTVIGQCPIPV